MPKVASLAQTRNEEQSRYTRLLELERLMWAELRRLAPTRSTSPLLRLAKVSPKELLFHIQNFNGGRKRKGILQRRFWRASPSEARCGEVRHFVRTTTSVERTERYKATTRSARAISSSHRDSARKTFELCIINTAVNVVNEEVRK